MFVGCVFSSLISGSSLVFWSLSPGFLVAVVTSDLLGKHASKEVVFRWLALPLVQ